MIYKELGTTGVRVPEIGLGTWRYHAGPEPLRKGLDAGALFIDTAESYGTEEVVADLLPYCQANNITILAYSPLARGL